MAFTQQFLNLEELSADENKRLKEFRTRFANVQDRLRSARDTGELPLLKLPHDRADEAKIQSVADSIRKTAKGLVVLGTGGSSLGGQTLCALAEGNFPVWFLDNLDARTIDRFLAAQDMGSMHVLIVSKSGGTVETLSQALALISAIIAKGGEKAVAKQCHAIAVPGNSPLRDLAARFNIPTLEHDPNVGGRYSVLSLVGLIPAAVAGIDISAIRAGAAAVLDDTLSNAQAAPLEGAAWQSALMPTRPVSVMMPYCDHLSFFAAWYQQLWAESLGKDGIGSTPVRALGAVDQHSQLQLYLGGPKDKSFTLLTLPHLGTGPKIDAQGIKTLEHLDGFTIGDVMAALQHGTIETMRRNQLPLRLLHLEKANAYTLGALLMHFMLETMASAELLGINAFDQPAVEESKQLAREYLTRKKQEGTKAQLRESAA